MPGTVSTFHSGAALPPSVLWRAGGACVVAGAVAAALLGAVLAELRRTGAWPPGALPSLAGALVLVAGAAATLLLVERERRKGPPSWRATDRGLVRIRGSEVRTLPWRRFRSVSCARTSGTRGDVILSPAGGLWLDAPFLRAEEGWVFAPGRGFRIADVERPDAVAATLALHLRAG